MPRATPILQEKARTLTLTIKPTGEALEGFRETFKALEGGRRVRRRAGVYFTSLEAARALAIPVA